MWLATSRAPPLVEWSLPPPSTCTPATFHFAGHSTFQGSLALPPNGDTRPLKSQPLAYAILSTEQCTLTVSPSKSLASVVAIFLQFGQITASGSHSSSFCEPDTSLYICLIL